MAWKIKGTLCSRGKENMRHNQIPPVSLVWFLTEKQNKTKNIAVKRQF